MDELPHFSPFAVEILRQPLEERKITVTRVSGNYEFPADFMMVAAMNCVHADSIRTGTAVIARRTRSDDIWGIYPGPYWNGLISAPRRLRLPLGN